MAYLLAFATPGPVEWLIIGLFGLLIFGKRLPEVGRSLGRGIVEFKKGLRGVEDDVDPADGSGTPSASQRSLPVQPSAPPGAGQPQVQQKFDPYTGKPLAPEFDPYTGKRLTPENTVSASADPTNPPQSVSH
jgi:sec-independent protein translocase protein TatA